MLPAHKGTSSINSKSHRFHPRNINSCTIRWTTWNHISIVSTWISQSLTCKTWTELLGVASEGTKPLMGIEGTKKTSPVTKLLDTLRGVNLRLRITFVYSIRYIDHVDVPEVWVKIKQKLMFKPPMFLFQHLKYYPPIPCGLKIHIPIHHIHFASTQTALHLPMTYQAN